MDRVKDICMYLVIGFAVSILLEAIDSTFLSKFYNENLLEIIIIIFSIDVTVVAWNAAKMKEYAGENIHYFSPVIKALKATITGQIIAIGVSLVLLVLNNSVLFSSVNYSQIVFDGLFGAILIYHIDVLRDTTNSIFTLLSAESDDGDGQ